MPRHDWSPRRRQQPRRALILTAGGTLALAASLALTAAAPGSRLQPVGEVRGAAATPEAQPSPPPPAWLAMDPRIELRRALDEDGPVAGAARRPPPIASLTGYVWPLAKGRLTLPFKAIPGGSRIKDGRLWHDGIDLATFCGDTVRAAHDGVVLAAGRRFDDHVGWLGDLSAYYANLDAKKGWSGLPIVVVIDDGNGYRSVYAHFSKVTVAAGDRVRAGQRIGYEGATGHASGCHVHYGLFSPLETETFGVREDMLRRLKLPPLEIARIDPLLVLPGGAEALETRRIPQPTPAPTPRPEPTPAGGA